VDDPRIDQHLQDLATRCAAFGQHRGFFSRADFSPLALRDVLVDVAAGGVCRADHRRRYRL
jgi:D-arabinose 1-dehydrogenase-like Zn-dependent alcohol dehydrogenase